jgi:hypothetical protein
MSMMAKIEKIIKENKNYLYQRIKNFLDKVPETDIFATQEQMKIDRRDGKSLEEKLINNLKAFIHENNIDIKNIVMPESIEVYFDTIIQFIENSKNNPREFHVLILMNLLTSKKGKEAINKYSENKSKTTTMDFIVKYTTLAF